MLSAVNQNAKMLTAGAGFDQLGFTGRVGKGALPRCTDPLPAPPRLRAGQEGAMSTLRLAHATSVRRERALGCERMLHLVAFRHNF